MRRAVIRFEYGNKMKEYENSFYCDEYKLRIRANRLLSFIAEEWNVPKGKITIEIKYIIKLR